MAVDVFGKENSSHQSPYYVCTTTRGTITVADSSANADLTGARVIRCTCDVDCYIEFGDNTVTADSTGTWYRAGTEMLIVPTSNKHGYGTVTHIAVIRNGTTNGTFQWVQMGKI